jgi:hypothetical protein
MPSQETVALTLPRAPSCSSRKSTDGSNTRLIVGLSVGAGVVLLALVLVMFPWPSGVSRPHRRICQPLCTAGGVYSVTPAVEPIRPAKRLHRERSTSASVRDPDHLAFREQAVERIVEWFHPRRSTDRLPSQMRR